PNKTKFNFLFLLFFKKKRQPFADIITCSGSQAYYFLPSLSLCNGDLHCVSVGFMGSYSLLLYHVTTKAYNGKLGPQTIIERRAYYVVSSVCVCVC
uniref:Uncharacterized protein n=1 Tax=Callorhinchus milii TaxID=7868 RepID=A0A4W3J6K2_CALMI